MLSPLYDRVIVEPEEAPEKTAGGLHLPENAREKPQVGVVQAVGEGRLIEMTGEFLEMQVKPGDRVLYGRYSGVETEHDGQAVLFLRESDILAIDEGPFNAEQTSLDLDD